MPSGGITGGVLGSRGVLTASGCGRAGERGCGEAVMVMTSSAVRVRRVLEERTGDAV
jgi:hypothetical protein